MQRIEKLPRFPFSDRFRSEYSRKKSRNFFQCTFLFFSFKDITIFSCSKSIPAKTNCMYIDPTVPWNHKTIDCLAKIILRYYGIISLQNHERIS
ncbi:hypothetical protein SLEP1_g57688 [Rubroshorea leprosula]|uniref:Uncharacterized protein n=1 Tax=Rubroshorea leprosula TaxID=152421 RepID=A0AAV5MQJ4_9ROSI|nr:hypothetical protein SLEP1_g57688 [Rubroshorea leprosula]